MRRCASAPPPRTADRLQVRPFFNFTGKVPLMGSGGAGGGPAYYGPLFPAIGGGPSRNQPYLGPSCLPGAYPTPRTNDVNPNIFPGVMTEGDSAVTWQRSGERMYTLDTDWIYKFENGNGEFHWKRALGRWGPRFSYETGKRNGSFNSLFAITGGGGGKHHDGCNTGTGSGRYYDIEEQISQRPPVPPAKHYERRGALSVSAFAQWEAQYKKWVKDMFKAGSGPMDGRNEIVTRRSTHSHEDHRNYMEKHSKFTEEELMTIGGSDFKNGRVGKSTEFYPRIYPENPTCWWNNTCRYTDEQIITGKHRLNMAMNRPLNTTSAGIHQFTECRSGCAWGRSPMSAVAQIQDRWLLRFQHVKSKSGPQIDVYWPFWNERGEPTNEENTATYASINHQEHQKFLKYHPMYVPYIVHDTQGNLIHKFMSGNMRESGPVKMDVDSHHFKDKGSIQQIDHIGGRQYYAGSHLGESKPWAPAEDAGEKKAVASQ